MTVNSIRNNYVRRIMSSYNTRPMGALLFTDTNYPGTTNQYQITLTATTIGINFKVGSTDYIINYVGKSTRQVASELNNSPFPIKVKSISDIQFLKEGELLTSGTYIPQTFDELDRSSDGKSAIVRCKRWAVRLNDTAAIQVLSPYPSGSVLPWWPRIKEGTFTKRRNGINYVFGVPEYKNQSWSQTSGYPFKDVEGEQVNFISPKKIKTARFPLYQKGNNIVITNNDGSRVFPSSVIQDVDTINGIIYIRDGINIPRNALIYYTYLENHYLYKDLNVNAHLTQNPSLIDRYIVFYALPISSNSGIAREKGIYHSVGNSIPEAINNITDLSMEEPLAILGAMHISPSIDSNQMNIVDTRSYGGGLRDDEYGEAAQEKYPITQYFNDLSTYDGIPYHGSAAVAIELPDEITSVMTLDEIRKAASKFVAKGVYTIIDIIEGPEYWVPTSGNGEISLLTVPRPREKKERVNLLNYSNNFYSIAQANSISGGTPWQYTYDNNCTDREGLSGSVVSLEGPVGEPEVWHLSLADSATGFHSISRRSTNLYGSGTDYFYEGDLGEFGDYQTFSAEVKEDTSEYFGVYFLESNTNTKYGSVFQWQAGIPVPITNTANAKAVHLRSGWWRCSYSEINEPDKIYNLPDKNSREVYFEPVASGAGGQVPSDFYTSGIYLANMQVENSFYFQERQVVPYLYSGETLDSSELSYTKLQDNLYGEEKESIGWINVDQQLPVSLTGDIQLTEIRPSPKNKLGDVSEITPGESYFLKYVKASPHTRVFHETVDTEGLWKKRVHLDKRTIPLRSVSAGKLAMTTRGNASTRNIKAFSPIVLIDTDSFVDEVAVEIDQIVKDLGQLSFSSTDNGMFQQDYVYDIVSGSTGSYLGELAPDVSYPITRPLYKGLLENYRYLANAGLYSIEQEPDNLIYKRAYHFYRATTDSVSKHYPQAFSVTSDDFVGFGTPVYDHFMGELYTYSSFVKDRIQEYYSEVGDELLSGAVKNSTGLALIRSGAFELAGQFEQEYDWYRSVTLGVPESIEIGTNVRSTYWTSQPTGMVPLSGDYSEMNTGISNQYMASDYIKSYAALYATQDRPTIADVAGAASLQFDFSPLKIAASGIAHSLHHFERYIDLNRYNGDLKTGHWIYTYDKYDNIAGKFLDNISSAFDNIYYGNDEWAGWGGVNNYESKLGPMVAEAEVLGVAVDNNFSYDTSFTGMFTYPTNETDTLENHLYTMVSGYKNITNKIRPMIEAMSNKGGVMTPGMAKLMKSFLWIPKHVANNEALFSGLYDENDVRAFEEGMGALVKGLYSEDGNCTEGITFKQDIIGKPYLASEILYHAMDGIDYYNALGDKENENRWIGVVQGIWDSTTGLYKESYGYPCEIIPDNSTGDLGTRIFPSMCRMMGLRSEEYTANELNLLTGSISGRF